ncbi:MAG: hypothetical protein HUJ69_01240 [Lachnospiraceae bacterium]|nr:hypothetical protein [Lachnospiraceae bacterium]
MKAFIVSDVRSFMRALLSEPLFKDWELRSAELSVLSHISIDGKINRDYLSDEEKQQHPSPYLKWEEIQPRIRSLIQGGKTPTLMHITLALDPSRFRGMPTDTVESLLLQIRYEIPGPGEGTAPSETAGARDRTDPQREHRLTLITGVALKTFTLDKTPEKMWDESIPAFFKAHSIPLTEA